MLEVLFVVVWATVIVLLIAFAIGVGGFFLSLSSLIPEREEVSIENKGGKISLWQTVKGWFLKDKFYKL